jgi:hypothetical protein
MTRDERYEIERQKFKEWVLKWNIGPGMNDGWRERGLPPPTYVPEKNYTGRDGTVGPGWVPILDRLAEDLIKLGWDRDLAQVKEKFGTLRFYVNRSTKEMDERINQAESESEKTCETCGKPGSVRGEGWVVAICDECEVIRNKERSGQ